MKATEKMTEVTDQERQTNKQTHLSPVNFKTISVTLSDENVMKENRTPLLQCGKGLIIALILFPKN